jgi:hypothetical protein
VKAARASGLAAQAPDVILFAVVMALAVFFVLFVGDASALSVR